MKPTRKTTWILILAALLILTQACALFTVDIPPTLAVDATGWDITAAQPDSQPRDPSHPDPRARRSGALPDPRRKQQPVPEQGKRILLSVPAGLHPRAGFPAPRRGAAR